MFDSSAVLCTVVGECKDHGVGHEVLDDVLRNGKEGLILIVKGVLLELVDVGYQAQKSKSALSTRRGENTIKPFFPAKIFKVPREPSPFRKALKR